MLCIQNNQLCRLEGCTVLLNSRWDALIWDSHYKAGAISPPDFLKHCMWGFFPFVTRSDSLTAASLNWSGVALLLFLSQGDWWASTCPALPLRPGEGAELLCPPHTIALCQPWHWRAVGSNLSKRCCGFGQSLGAHRAKGFTVGFFAFLFFTVGFFVGFFLTVFQFPPCVCSPLASLESRNIQKWLELLGEKKTLPAIDLNGNKREVF